MSGRQGLGTWVLGKALRPESEEQSPETHDLRAPCPTPPASRREPYVPMSFSAILCAFDAFLCHFYEISMGLERSFSFNAGRFSEGRRKSMIAQKISCFALAERPSPPLAVGWLAVRPPPHAFQAFPFVPNRSQTKSKRKQSRIKAVFH